MIYISRFIPELDRSTKHLHVSFCFKPLIAVETSGTPPTPFPLSVHNPAPAVSNPSLSLWLWGAFSRPSLVTVSH